MREKGLQKVSHKKKQPPVLPQVTALGKLFRKKGCFDGKIFHFGDKVTYTFISEEKEVVSLHFDRQKQTIYHQGHNVANLALTPNQLNYMEQFSIELAKKPETKDFIQPFLECLNKIAGR